MTLTGSYRLRSGFRGKLVLQVEYKAPVVDTTIALLPGVNRLKEQTAWRDAKVTDLHRLPAFLGAALNGE